MAALFSLGSARDTNSSLSAGASSSAFGAGKSRKPTVGAIFTRELKALVELLESTSSHFIRCIKPNASKSATAVERRMVLEQLTYSGVFEAVQIRRLGYPFRMTHTHFYHRFLSLVDDKAGLSDKVHAFASNPSSGRVE